MTTATGRTPHPDREPEVLRRFAEARLWAAAQAPYLASAVFALRPVVLEARSDEHTGEPVPDPEFRALPTDTRWRVHLDPGTLLTTPVEETGWWLLHHIGHLVRRHAARGPNQGAGRRTGGTGGADEEAAHRWNQAADAEVNDDLESAGLTTPEGVVSPRALGLPEGRLAEEYVSLIEVLDTAHRRGGRRLVDLVDCGPAVRGLDGRYEETGAGEGIDDTERHVLELALARDIERRAAARTAVPGGWRRWAEDRRRPVVDWRTRLGAVLRRGVRRTTGRVDFSYRRPSRRPGPGGVLLPTMVAPAPGIALVIDTSGSVAAPVLAGFLSEITGVLARAAGPERRLRAICCDDRAHPVQEVREAADIELTGGGGTDLRAGIAAALALRPRPDLVLVLTDGHTPWPERRPPVPVVVGLVAAHPPPADAPTPPAWAHPIPLPATAPRGAEA
ncbi:vWA domain-containing protein [Actinoalloteichus caeruleus]|uniref:vWA domain-containing protein n=1 Tax=Actinoalloteichus cyanogriseus TaxID=2893586 RepID=UPI003AAFDA2E